MKWPLIQPVFYDIILSGPPRTHVAKYNVSTRWNDQSFSIPGQQICWRPVFAGLSHTHTHTYTPLISSSPLTSAARPYVRISQHFLNVNVMQRSVACFVLRPRSKCDSELQLWGQCLRHCLHQYLHQLVNSKLVGAGDGTPKQPHFQESAAAAASTVKTRSIMFSRISSDVIFTAPRCRSLSFLSRLETDTDTDTWFSLFFCFLVDFQ